jgi:hypothetical protein
MYGAEVAIFVEDHVNPGDRQAGVMQERRHDGTDVSVVAGDEDLHSKGEWPVSGNGSGRGCRTCRRTAASCESAEPEPGAATELAMHGHPACTSANRTTRMISRPPTHDSRSNRIPMTIALPRPDVNGAGRPGAGPCSRARARAASAREPEPYPGDTSRLSSRISV